MKLSKFDNFSDYGTFIGGGVESDLPYVSAIGTDIVAYVNKPGVSVEFPESGGGGGNGYHLGDEMELTIPYGVDNTQMTIKYKFGDLWGDYINSDNNTNGLRFSDDFLSILFDIEEGFYAKLVYEGAHMNVAPFEMIYPWRKYEWSIVG